MAALPPPGADVTGEFAGTLAHRVVIEALSDLRTDSGLADGSWEPIANCRAAIVAEGVGAEAEGMAFSVMPRVRVVIRNRPRIAVQQRLRWRGRLFMIRNVHEDPRQPERLELRCEEVRT